MADGYCSSKKDLVYLLSYIASKHLLFQRLRPAEVAFVSIYIPSAQLS